MDPNKRLSTTVDSSVDNTQTPRSELLFAPWANPCLGVSSQTGTVEKLGSFPATS